MKKQNDQLMKTFQSSNLKKFNDPDEYKEEPYTLTKQNSSEPILLPSYKAGVSATFGKQMGSPLGDEYLDPHLPVTHEEKDYRGDSSIELQNKDQNIYSAEYLDPSLPISHAKPKSKKQERGSKSAARQKPAGKSNLQSGEGIKGAFSDIGPSSSSVYRDEYPAYGILERTRPKPPSSAALNVFSDNSQDQRIIDEKSKADDTIKAYYRSQLPPAGRKTTSDDSLKEMFADANAAAVVDSVSRQDYPQWGNIERTNPSKPSLSSQVIPFDGDVPLKSKSQLQYASRTSSDLPAAGRKNAKLPGDGIESMYQENDIGNRGESIYRNEYPPWGVHERVMAAPSTLDRLNLFSGDNMDYSAEEKHSENNQFMPIAGKATTMDVNKKLVLGADDGHDMPKTSEYHDKFPVWDVQPEKHETLHVDRSSISLAYDNATSADWQSEQRSNFVKYKSEIPRLSIRSKSNETFGVADLSHDSIPQISEYKEKYLPWSVEEVPANSPYRRGASSTISLTHAGNSKEDLKSFSPSRIASNDNPAGKSTKPTIPAQYLFNSSSEALPAVSEYLAAYPSYSYEGFERVKPYNPLSGDRLPMGYGDQTPWNSEHRQMFRPHSDITLPSSSAIAGKPSQLSSDGVITTNVDVNIKRTSEYKDSYVNMLEFERVKPFIPPAESMLKIKDIDDVRSNSEYQDRFLPFEGNHVSPSTKKASSSTISLDQGYAGRADSEYHDKFRPHDTPVNDFPAGKASELSHGLFHSTESFPFGSSEYRQQYSPRGFASSMVEIKKQPVESTKETIFPSTSGIKSSWETEHRTSFVLLPDAEDSAISSTVKEKFTDHVDLIALTEQKTLKGIKSEYQEKFVPWDPNSISRATIHADARRDNVAAVLSPSLPIQWKSEYEEKYSRMDPAAAGMMTIAGKPIVKDSLRSLADPDQKPNREMKSEYSENFIAPVLPSSTDKIALPKDTLQLESLDAIPTHMWKSEQQNMYSFPNESTSTLPVAGKKSEAKGKLPMQFAWKALSSG
jgi:hypothetical protein